MPREFAPEEQMPADIRRAERIREREAGYQLAEWFVGHGGSVRCAALLLIPLPRNERNPQMQWRVRLEEAILAADTTVCSMPVRGCWTHGDSLEWRAGQWKCRVPKCRGYCQPKKQRRHCESPRVASIEYPSGHRRRLCAGHLLSEQALWADTPPGAPTIRVTAWPPVTPAESR
jgi:hypothetical protein